MPYASTWEPRHVVDPVPQNHEIRADLVRTIPRLTGPHFRARRTYLGLNHSHVATVCEVTTRTITRWEALSGTIPLVACEQIQAVVEASAAYYQQIAHHGTATIYSYGWRVLPESGLCLPETWWHAVAGVVPDVEIVWAKGHPAAVPNNEAARRRATSKTTGTAKTAAKSTAAKSTPAKNGTEKKTSTTMSTSVKKASSGTKKTAASAKK